MKDKLARSWIGFKEILYAPNREDFVTNHYAVVKGIQYTMLYRARTYTG